MFSTSAKDDNISNLKNVSQAASADLHEAANQAGRKVRSILNSAGNEIAQAGEKLTTEIRANPVRSSVIALGLGMAIAALIRR